MPVLGRHLMMGNITRETFAWSALNYQHFEAGIRLPVIRHLYKVITWKRLRVALLVAGAHSCPIADRTRRIENYPRAFG